MSDLLPPDPVEFFKTEFFGKSETAVERLEALQNIRYVADCLNSDQIKKKLLPILEGVAKSQDTDDELLLALANQTFEIGRLFPAEAIHLLPILESLAGQEELVVRQAATDNMKRIALELYTDQHVARFVEESLFPLWERLVASDNFPARVSACALLPLCYQHCAGAARRRALRTALSSLLKDDAPTVARTAASKLSELARCLPKDAIIQGNFHKAMVDCWENDIHDFMRVEGIRALMTLAVKLTESERAQLICPHVKVAIKDRSWKVRTVVAQEMKAVSEVMTVGELSSVLLGWVETFLMDSQADIQSMGVNLLLPCVLRLPYELVVDEILPLVLNICERSYGGDRPGTQDRGFPGNISVATDTYPTDTAPNIISGPLLSSSMGSSMTGNVVPSTIGGSVIGGSAAIGGGGVVGLGILLGSLSKRLGAGLTEDILLPIIIKIINNKNEKIILSFSDIFLILGSEKIIFKLYPILRRLLKSQNQWRIRLLITLQISKIPFLFGFSYFVQQPWIHLFLSSLLDHSYAVRSTTVQSIYQIGTHFGPNNSQQLLTLVQVLYDLSSKQIQLQDLKPSEIEPGKNGKNGTDNTARGDTLGSRAGDALTSRNGDTRNGDSRTTDGRNGGDTRHPDGARNGDRAGDAITSREAPRAGEPEVKIREEFRTPEIYQTISETINFGSRAIDSYITRNTLLHALEKCALIVKSEEVEENILPRLTLGLSDPIPNIRFTSLRIIANIVESNRLSPTYVEEKLLTIIQKRGATDSDPDVRFFANETKKRCRNWLSQDPQPRAHASR